MSPRCGSPSPWPGCTSSGVFFIAVRRGDGRHGIGHGPSSRGQKSPQASPQPACAEAVAPGYSSWQACRFWDSAALLIDQKRRCGSPLIRIQPGDQLSSKRYSYSPATLPQFVSQMSLLLAGPVRLRGISLADGRLSCGKKGRFSTDLTIFSTENRRNSRFKKKNCGFCPECHSPLDRKGRSLEGEPSDLILKTETIAVTRVSSEISDCWQFRESFDVLLNSWLCGVGKPYVRRLNGSKSLGKLHQSRAGRRR